MSKMLKLTAIEPAEEKVEVVISGDDVMKVIKNQVCAGRRCREGCPFFDTFNEECVDKNVATLIKNGTLKVNIEIPEGLLLGE